MMAQGLGSFSTDLWVDIFKLGHNVPCEIFQLPTGSVSYLATSIYKFLNLENDKFSIY